MTEAERKEAVRQFVQRWAGKGREDEDARSYWIEFLHDIIGMEDVTKRVDFEKKVIGPDGNTKRIDVYVPETRVLIEQKSLGIDLSKPQQGHDGMTPYQQAKMYDNSLPVSEKAKWIIVSNFKDIWVYDMDTKAPEKEVKKFELSELTSKYSLFDFLINKEEKKISEEMEISIKAGEFVGLLYDALLKQYKDPSKEESLRSLNMLCVRLVFCLYAEDAHIFGTSGHMFHDYLAEYDIKNMRKALIELFKILDTPEDQRDPYDESILSQFPYANGGLFAEENIEIPNFTDEIKDILLEKASAGFDWSKISPTIFGAVFESTLNPETRRAGGMHYTSIENIHKVIDPLFLDDLKAELEDIKAIQMEKSRNTKLDAFQDKLASLSWLDPACGSGNFLTETYISIRRLENETIKLRKSGQMAFMDAINPIKVSISQFYGIEINDFAVTVAKTALWIAESQMMKETEEILLMNLDFLPLKTNANIVEGNALRIDWESVVPKDELNYIMGNPPFVGASMMTSTQKNEATAIFGKIKLANSIDYVGAWYYKASEYMKDTSVHAALVSTNSITQGEQVAPLWQTLLDQYGIQLYFAYRTFRWDSEASIKAHVHCVIIGFGCEKSSKDKVIYYPDGNIKKVGNIHPYLIDAPNVFIKSRSTPICDVPNMTKGNQPTDGGNFILTEEEKNSLISQDKNLEICIRRYIGARDYLNNDETRYCLWLKGVNPSIYRGNKEIQRRLSAIKELRENSTAAPTRKFAEKPYLFFSSPQTDENYMIIPRVSSERRSYIPIGFMSPENIAADSCSIVCGASLYHFGVMTSNVHNAWMRVVAGRLEMRYRYSGAIVYNNFPWPSPTDEQKTKIEQTAQGILDARALYSDSSLADLYDPLTMPPELRKAHIENDKAVMRAYGFSVKDMSEADCVAALMKMYQELTTENQE